MEISHGNDKAVPETEENTDASQRPELSGKHCTWCGKDLALSGTGRKRRYCKQSCRQRAYEQRHALSSASIAEDSVILSRHEHESLIERLYLLRCACEDLNTAIVEASSLEELSEMSSELVSLARDAERLR